MTVTTEGVGPPQPQPPQRESGTHSRLAATKTVDKSALLSMLRQAIKPHDDGGPPLDEHRIVLCLYVNDSPHSLRARLVVGSVLADYNPEQVDLRIINVVERTDLAEDDGILATPTLVKKYPAPRAWITGSLDDDGKLVRSMLDAAGVEKKQ